MTPAGENRGERGFALLVVLWTVALLGLLGTQLGSRVRAEAGVALGARDSAVLEAAANGGVSAAIYHLLARDWDADGSVRRTAFGPISLMTTVSNEAGRINPNLSPFVLVRGLLQTLGCDAGQAQTLAMAMVLWRQGGAEIAATYRASGLPYGPAGTAFQSVDEIRLVPGMNRTLVDLMRPHLTLFNEGDVDVRFADPIVVTALAKAGEKATPLRSLHVVLEDLLVEITVEAIASQGRRFRRTAEVRFAAHPEPGAPDYTVLSWGSE